MPVIDDPAGIPLPTPPAPGALEPIRSTPEQPLTRRQLRALEEARAGIVPQVPLPVAEQVAVPLGPLPVVSFTTAEQVAAPIAAFASAPITQAAEPERAYPRRSGASSKRDIRTAVRLARPTRAPRPARRAGAYSPLFSTVAMLFAGALLVGVSVPANAFMPKADIATVPEDTREAIPTQALAITDEVGADLVARDSFTVTSYAEMLRLKYGSRSYSFAATNGAVRWPFPMSVPISDGYGERVAPCRGCSSYHRGVDFTPGAGAAIFSIAAGTVVISESSGNGFGTQVGIEHVIKGQKVTSFYGHMKAGSVPLAIGQTVAAGDFVGLVGETGAAVGAHLHLEIWLDGVQVDPYAWLKRNAVN